MTQPGQFKVYWRKEGDPQGPRTWQKMRRGIGDLPRRARVSQQCNRLYVAALASVEAGPRLEELAERLERPTLWKGKVVRGLHPFSGPDSTLFQVISRGGWSLCGFRNADLQRHLFRSSPNPDPLPRPGWPKGARISEPPAHFRAGEAPTLGVGDPPNPVVSRPSLDPEGGA